MDARNTTALEPSRLMSFDEESLRERVQGNEKLFNELMEIFLGDLPKRIQEIRAAVSEVNLEKVESAAHTLKGTAALMGAQRLARAARVLETSAHSRSKEFVPKIFAHLLEESERLRELLALYHHEIKP